MADLFLIPYVRTTWEMLHHRLEPGGRMCIFGAGAHTRWLLSITDELPSPTIECIIDEDPTQDALCGIPVHRPDQVSIESIDLVLISSDRWEEQLAARCRSLWGDRVSIVRLYEGLPRGPYDKRDDRTEALHLLERRRTTGVGDPQEVVIVSNAPRAREAKIAHALKRAGWKVVLLHRGSPSFDASRYFDEVRPFDHEWAALRTACDYSPAAFHVMVHTDYRVAELFVRHRPGVVVVDSYDMVAGMYTKEYLAGRPELIEEADRERFCLEGADGLCCRCLETDFLDERLRYRLPPRILVPDGCWNAKRTNAPSPAPPPLTKGGMGGSAELHLVYAGKADFGSDRSERFAACGCNPELFRRLACQGLHLHLYPSPEQVVQNAQEQLAAYRDLDESSPHFHLHQPVAADRLADELSQYDAALSVYPELPAPSGLPWSITADKLRCCTSNKFYDYLDAGLPIIHNAPARSFLAGIVQRHGVGIDVSDWPLDEWAQRLHRLDLAAIRKRLPAARAAHDAAGHGNRLAEFYRSIAQRSEEVPTLSSNRTEQPEHADNRTDHRPAIV